MLSVWKKRYKICFPSKVLFSFVTNKRNHLLTQDGPGFQRRWRLRKIKLSLWKPSLSHSPRNGIQKLKQISKSSPHYLQCLQRIIAKREDNCFKVGLPRLPVRASQWCWKARDHLQAVAGCLSHHKHISGWISICSGLMGLLFFYYPISYLLLSLPGFKGALACHAQNRGYSSCSELRTLHHWANPSATWLKCHPSPLSTSQLFLHNKWHFIGMTKHHFSIKQACILEWLKSRCMNREVFCGSLLPFLTWPGLRMDWIPGSCTGGR